MRRARARRPWLGALALAAGCSGQLAPRAQWKVYLATDVPIPTLGQQVIVQFLDAQGNASATDAPRLMDASTPALWPISFGVLPAGTPLRLRVRLYRLDQTGADGLPAGSALLDATATLPPVTDTGIVPVVLPLAAACFGVAADPSGHQTCDPVTGVLGPEPILPVGTGALAMLQVGSWAPGRTIPCPGAPPSGMTCIPGGVFLLGRLHYFPSFSDPVPEHLVQISPFAIDTDEVTVGTVRGLVRSQGLPEPRIGDPDPSASPPECTYLGTNVADQDAYPVNCVPWSTASRACQLVGKRLPTEAEWEYVAGNLGDRTSYPWGFDPDVCGHAIVARGRPLLGEPYECRGTSTTPGPTPGGSALDVTTQGVRNLAGNLDEWVQDLFDDYSAPCWQPAGSLLVDPVCMRTSKSPAVHSNPGGSWQLSTVSALVYEREAAQSDAAAVSTGFRCAVSM